MTTRAVHIEVVSSMDVISCVIGIERLIARRGTLSVIWSDNCTNYRIALSRGTHKHPKIWRKRVLSGNSTPSSHASRWFLWTSLRCCKMVFYAIIGSRKLTPEVLETSYCLVEQSLNARPTTSVSASPDGFEVLTPNHFLLSRNGTSFPSNTFQEHFDHQ